MTVRWVDSTKTLGNDDGTSEADAFLSIEGAMGVWNAGDDIRWKNTETQTGKLSCMRSGDVGNFIEITAYDDSGPLTDDYAVLDGNSAADNWIEFNNVMYIKWTNIHFTNCTSHGLEELANSEGFVFENCKFSLCGGRALYRLNDLTFNNCVFLNNSDVEVYQATNVVENACIHINGLDCIWGGSNYRLINTIIHDYDTGITSATSDSFIISCIIDTIAYAAIALTNDFSHIYNSRITNSTTGISFAASAKYSTYGHNYFYNPGDTDITDGSTVSHDMGGNRLTGVNSGTGYADLGSHDFTLTPGDDGVNVESSIGGFGDETNSVWITSGLQPEPPAGGGGGMLVAPGFNGGLNG